MKSYERRAPQAPCLLPLSLQRNTHYTAEMIVQIHEWTTNELTADEASAKVGSN